MLARTLEAASKRALANPHFSDLRTELLLSARDVRVRRPEIAERVYRKSGYRDAIADRRHRFAGLHVRFTPDY